MNCAANEGGTNPQSPMNLSHLTVGAKVLLVFSQSTTAHIADNPEALKAGNYTERFYTPGSYTDAVVVENEPNANLLIQYGNRVESIDRNAVNLGRWVY